MDIFWEIAVWGVMAIVFTAAFVSTLPAFFRHVRGNGADVFPDFLKSDNNSARGKSA